MLTENSSFNWASNPERGERWHVDQNSGEVKCNYCMVDGHVQFSHVTKPGEPNYPDTADYKWGP
jgi:prepilin-type processing-associated H-X9-DG protein